MPCYTLKTTSKTYNLHFTGDNHARYSAQREANLIGSNVSVFDALGRLLWIEQPDDSPLRKSSRYTNPQNESVF